MVIFDTTLRDGEQSPGINLSLSSKVEIANILELLKVDVIEAGFAASSDSCRKSITAISRTITDAKVCSLSRALDNDIDLAAEALHSAKSPRINVVLATSTLHMREKLRMLPNHVLEHGVRAVSRARRFTSDVSNFRLNSNWRRPFIALKVLFVVN